VHSTCQSPRSRSASQAEFGRPQEWIAYDRAARSATAHRRPQAREYFGLLDYSLGERLPELTGETEIVDNLPARCVVERIVRSWNRFARSSRRVVLRMCRCSRARPTRSRSSRLRGCPARHLPNATLAATRCAVQVHANAPAHAHDHRLPVHRPGEPRQSGLSSTDSENNVMRSSAPPNTRGTLLAGCHHRFPPSMFALGGTPRRMP